MINTTMHPLPQPRRALLADDNHSVRMTLGRVISSFDFDVTYAENGKRALELFDHAYGGFDLLITDICMPEMNGNDLVHEIRRRDQELPIITITGFAEPKLISEIESCNVRLFEKPINFEALRSYIGSLQYK